MKTTYLLSALALFGTSVAIGSGCKVTVSETDDGGGGSAGGSTTGPTGPTGTTSSTGSGGGSMGDGNDSFEEAKDLTVGTPMTDQLNPKEDFDFFKFSGTEGDAIVIATDAKVSTGDPFAPGYADLVITLYDENQQRIAENDDPIPRSTQDSQLYTVLPSTGTYYLRVGDFCHWAEQETGTNPCAESYAITNGAYGVNVLPLDFENEASRFKENATSDTITYGGSAGGTNSGYFSSTILGTFDDTADVDTYKFQIPSDWDLPSPPWPANHRPTAYFETYPAGAVEGNGSTAPTGEVWVTTTADPGTNVIAKIDAANIDPTFGMDLRVPLTFGQDYWVHVKTSASSAVGANPFYFLSHGGSGSNTVEAEAASSNSNNTTANAEVLASDMSSTGNTVYWVAGDVDSGTDVDYFQISLTGIAAPLKMACGFSAGRSGSGLEGLTMTIMKASDESTVVTHSETAGDNANCGEMGVDIPTGETDLLVKIEATGQSATVSGTYWSGGVWFFQPSN